MEAITGHPQERKEQNGGPKMEINNPWNRGKSNCSTDAGHEDFWGENQSDSAPYYVKTLSFPLAFVEGRLCHRDNYPALAVLKGYGIYCHCIPKPDV